MAKESPRVRVAHLTSVHARRDTRIFLKECRSLVAADFEVFLIVADGEGPAVVDGVQIVDVGLRAPRRAARALVTAAHVFAAAQRVRADIYHFHDPELLPWGLLLRLSGKRVVYDAHEHLPHDVLSKRYLPAGLLKPISLIAGSCELLAARGLSAVVAATPDILQRFQGSPLASIGVYNFPLTEELLSGGDWNDRQVQACYVGGISLNRGVREVAAAAGLCRARIVLAGPLWDGLTQEQLAAMPGWSRINYRGVLSRTGVADVMASSRVGIVTLLPTTSHLNSLPTKLFEYMSAGMAVVASDFPLWRKIVSETGSGLCIDPTDPAAIATAVDRLVSDTEFGAACGRNGARAVTTEFNWSAQASKLLQLYRQLQPQRGSSQSSGSQRADSRD